MESIIQFLLYLTINVVLCSASINGHSSKLSKHPYKDYYENSGTCFQAATCQPVQNITCFGTSLPYAHTSIDLAEDSGSQFEIQDNLALWQGLRSVPRCWAVIQPLLCAVYMPKCENGSVSLPSKEMCRITRGPCKTVEIEQGWPSFLQCDNKKLFPSRCRNPLQEIKFNTSYKCISPLVETDNPDNWFHDVEGCGIQCQNPLYTMREHEYTHYILSIFSSLSLAITVITVLTFIIKWKALNKYPEKIVFYLNLCWAIVSFGCIIQFFPGAREEIVCVHDGTIRRRQPESGQHLCTITFILIYYFLMAAIIWFVILAFTWYATHFRDKGVPKDIEKKKSYFHMGAWCIPLVLGVIIMAFTAVDGDSMSGICFVGFSNFNMRLIFVLLPVGIAALVGGSFLVLFLYNLIKVFSNSEEVTNELARKKIRSMIFRRGFFLLCFLILICITSCCHAYDFINRQEWNESLKDYIVCLARHSGQTYSSFGDAVFPKCVLKSKPNVTVLHVHLSCLLIFGVMVSSLVCRRATLEIWKSFFYSLCAPAEKNASTIKKHQLISKAFQKRHELNQGSVSNFSFSSAHEDPLGLNVDLSNIASSDISASWVMALPHLLMRRNAIAGIDPFMPRQYSSASDVSRHISLDSFNQPALDSLSMQISERDYQVHAWRQKRKTRKERERFLRANRIAPWFPGNRRGSDTSLQSSLVAAAAASKNANIGMKVTKSTSTGDLGVQPTIAEAAMMSSLMLPQPRHKSLIQQSALNPPPFTHGRYDNSHRMECRNAQSAVGQRFTPIPLPSNIQTPLPMIRPPLYPQGYDVMNTIPTGFIPGGMYPPINGMYPRYPSTGNFTFPSYNMPYFPYSGYQNIDTLPNEYQPSLIPLHPRADSASGTEYLPIIMSDSEYTDTGFRSYDESQVLTTQRLMQERLQAQLLAKAQREQLKETKPVLEPQACDKHQFSQRLKADTTNTQTSRPCSSRKSHNTAPPPSPAESIAELINTDVINSETINSENIINSEDGDDEVFLDDPVPLEKSSSVAFLPSPPESETVLQKLKSKFMRNTSSSKNFSEPETIELAVKRQYRSLDQLSNIDSISSSQKNSSKEKALNIQEKECLLNNNETVAENISR